MSDNRLLFDWDAMVQAVAERAANVVMARLADQAQPADPVSDYVTIPEAAQLLRCKRQRVDDLLSAGRLTRVKDGRRTLVSRAELAAYLAGGRTGPRLGAPRRPHPRRSQSGSGVAT